jgi:hypothetical protein
MAGLVPAIHAERLRRAFAAAPTSFAGTRRMLEGFGRRPTHDRDLGASTRRRSGHRPPFFFRLASSIWRGSRVPFSRVAGEGKCPVYRRSRAPLLPWNGRRCHARRDDTKSAIADFGPRMRDAPMRESFRKSQHPHPTPLRGATPSRSTGEGSIDLDYFPNYIVDTTRPIPSMKSTGRRGPQRLQGD